MANYDRAIPPGGAGEITLRVNTSGYQGRITKSAVVFTNDPAHRKAVIMLSINVRPYIVVEPAPRVLLCGIAGDAIRQVLEISANDDYPLEITSIETNLRPSIDCTLKRTDSHRYELHVVSKARGRNFARGFLRLLTSHPQKKELRLPVHIRVRPEMEAWPGRVAFGEVARFANGGQGVKQVLTIVNNRGRAFRLRQLDYNSEYFKIRPLTPADASTSRWQLEITPLVDQLPAGRVRFQDTLIVTTDLAQAGELKVPMSIRLKGPK